MIPLLEPLLLTAVFSSAHGPGFGALAFPFPSGTNKEQGEWQTTAVPPLQRQTQPLPHLCHPSGHRCQMHSCRWWLCTGRDCRHKQEGQEQLVPAGPHSLQALLPWQPPAPHFPSFNHLSSLQLLKGIKTNPKAHSAGAPPAKSSKLHPCLCPGAEPWQQLWL